MRVLAAIQTGGKATELGERLSQCALIAGRLRGPTQCFAGGPLVWGPLGDQVVLLDGEESCPRTHLRSGSIGDCDSGSFRTRRDQGRSGSLLRVAPGVVMGSRAIQECCP